MGRLLMEGFHGRKGYMKLSWEDLAERVHKDSSTLKKQMSLDSNSSMKTLDEIAAAMDSEIVLLSGDALADFKSSGVPRAQKNLADMDREIEKLKLRLDEKDAEIDRLRKMLDEMIANQNRLVKELLNLKAVN